MMCKKGMLTAVAWSSAPLTDGGSWADRARLEGRPVPGTGRRRRPGCGVLGCVSEPCLAQKTARASGRRGQAGRKVLLPSDPLRPCEFCSR